MSNEFKYIQKKLVDAITKNIYPYKFNTPRTELAIRCPYCGDSIKSERSTHLYIEIVNEDIFMFYCQRCDISGVVTSEFLKDIKLYDFELAADLNKFNKNRKFDLSRNTIATENTVRKVNNIKNLKLPEYKNRHYNKLNYLNNRFKIDIDPSVWVDEYRVVFSLIEFLILNDLKPVDLYNKNFVRKINDQFIGFLSHDKTHIVFRNIDMLDKHRYFIYTINKNPDGKKIYMPKQEIDIMSEKIHLIMTEGIFDIIGVKEHFKEIKRDNTIYVSANGKGYNYIINYFARLGFIDMDIDIYSDNDVGLNFYKGIRNVNPVFKNSNVRIFYNDKSKDFGVPITEINSIFNYL